MKKKLLSFVLAVCMTLGLAAALPENEQGGAVSVSAHQLELSLPSGGADDLIRVEELDTDGQILPQVSSAQQKLNGTVTDPALPFEKTSSPYIYKCLSNYKHGNSLRQLYRDMLDKLEEIWYSDGDWSEYKTSYEDEKQYLAAISYKKYGLTKEEIITAARFLVLSLPLDFFTEDTVYFNTSDSILYFALMKGYTSASVRSKYTKKILSYIKSYESCVKGKTKQYQKAAALHDELCKRTEYAYVPGTNTPEPEKWAHCITGAIDKNSVVCVGYALVYEMLVNYYGGDCSYCLGQTAGGSHAWNIIRLDDGRYYYVDPTWNDSYHNDGDKVSHTYFAVGTDTFYKKHIRRDGYDKREITENLFQYYLPAIPKSDYDPSSKPHSHSYKTTVVAPTCTEEGCDIHKCSGCMDEYRDNFKPLAAHKWHEPEWTWSKDNKTAKAKFVCDNDKSHVKTLNAKVSVEKTPATCEKNGMTETVAMVKLNGRIYSMVKTQKIEKLGHKWHEPVWTWSKDNKTAKAKFVCDNDKSHVMTLNAKVSVEKTPAACEKNGMTETVAMVKLNGRIYSMVKTRKIEKLGHKWTSWTKTKKATCTADGVQTRKCTVCGKTETKTIAKTGHKFSAWKTTSFNLKNKTSTQTRKCSVCGKTETQTNKNAVTRLAGANRYETASIISKKMNPKTSDTVIIATGLTFHDAMVAVPLASAYNAPLLLATEKHITAQTEAELKRLKAKNVIVVSTNGAIGAGAKAELKALKLKTTYIEGKNVFETSTKVAKALQTQNKKAPDTIFFATDGAFADALSASPVAAIKGAPIIYLNNKSIDKATADYLKSVKGKIKNAYIIGGNGVISDAMMKNVAKALGLTSGKTVQRVAGANRYETCVAVNNKFKSVLSSDGICVAKGLDFPDALAGGVYAASTKQALFLADGKKLQDVQNTYLKSKNAGKITVFGGTGAVSDELVKLIAKASV